MPSHGGLSHIIFRLFPLAYGILLLLLATFKAAEFWKLNGFHGSHLVFVLIRDQVMYFVLHVACPNRPASVFVNVSLRAIFVAVFATIGDKFLFNNSAVNYIVVSLDIPTLLSILGSRMFFNLREAAEHGVNVGTNWSSYSHSAIRFNESQRGENM